MPKYDKNTTYKEHTIQYKIGLHTDEYVQVSGPAGEKTFMYGSRNSLYEKARSWIDDQLRGQKRRRSNK